MRLPLRFFGLVIFFDKAADGKHAAIQPVAVVFLHGPLSNVSQPSSEDEFQATAHLEAGGVHFKLVEVVKGCREDLRLHRQHCWWVGH